MIPNIQSIFCLTSGAGIIYAGLQIGHTPSVNAGFALMIEGLNKISNNSKLADTLSMIGVILTLKSTILDLKISMQEEAGTPISITSFFGDTTQLLNHAGLAASVSSLGIGILNH